MEKNATIYIARARTLIGAAIRRELERTEYQNLVGGPADEPDLTDASQVDAFLNHVAPDYIFVPLENQGVSLQTRSTRQN